MAVGHVEGRAGPEAGLGVGNAIRGDRDGDTGDDGEGRHRRRVVDDVGFEEGHRVEGNREGVPLERLPLEAEPFSLSDDLPG